MARIRSASRDAAPGPRLDFVYGRRDDPDLVIIAHGGQENSYARAHTHRPAALRMWPFVHAAHDAAPSAAVAFVRYRYRGWNGDHAHPLEDLRSLVQDAPTDVRRILLVGHSMGGRAVMQCAGDDRVAGVLALAPWLPDTDPVPGASSAHSRPLIVTAHGTHDKITNPSATSGYVHRLRESGWKAADFRVRHDIHALLCRHADWDELVHRFVTSALTGTVDPVIAHALTDDPAHRPDELPQWSDHRGPKHAVLAITRARARSIRTSIVGE